MGRDIEANNCALPIFTSATEKKRRNCRQKLQDRFNGSGEQPLNGEANNRSVMSLMSFKETRKLFHNGAELISNGFSKLRTSIGTFSQRFKVSTQRRQILDESVAGSVCATPHTISKQILGRTPTKLYSPFSIESPYAPTTTTTAAMLARSSNK